MLHILAVSTPITLMPSLSFAPPLEHYYSCLRLKTGGNKPPLILEASLLTSYSRTKNVMTCVTAARASHLVLGLKFPKPAQAGLGVAGTEFPLFSACSGLLVSDGGHLVPGEGCQHSGDAWADANRLCWQKRGVGFRKESENTFKL